MSQTLEEKQRAIEVASEGLAVDKYHKDLTDAITQGRFDDTKEGMTLMKIMFVPLNSKIQEYLGTTYRGHTEKTQNYIKLMSDDSREITYILLKELVTKIAQHNNLVSIATLAMVISKSLKKLHYFNRLKVDNPKLHSYLGSEYRRASAKRKLMLIDKHIKDLYILEEEDGGNVNDLKAGTQLIEIVLSSGLDILKQTRQMIRRGKATYYLSFTEETLEILFKSNSSTIFSTIMLPMMCEPRDWVSLKDGGYIKHKINLIKVHTKKDRAFLKTQDFSKIYPVVNKLQKTSWKINKRVADIINDIFEANMIDPKSPPTLPRCYGGIPTANIPDIKDLIPYKEYKPDAPPDEKKEWGLWNKKREAIKIGLDGEIGRRLQFMLTMDMVREVIDYNKFWYVYQLDYRGRVYPNTDFLNPQSKGYTKAMLEFADGELLSPRGLIWLKIHTANSWGLDKEPFAYRVNWFEENRENMLAVANNPMDNLNIWTDADSPYEFLAACFAYQDHIEGRQVHLPIQLDAVNSGVQFYSGLLLDKEGAESCCVIGSKRSDLYGMVAKRVNERLIGEDYPKLLTFTDSEGIEKTLSTRVEAKSLAGKITRSMTKTNVMTVPYSVTMRGMKMQNWNTMDTMKLEGKSFWKGDDWVVNYLITELNYQSIFEIVKGARIGQTFLRDVATTLTEPAFWTTPLFNFPVRQPVLKKKELRVKTPLGTLSISVGTDELSRQKQLSSIAANYIHSIDSTLLLWCVEHISSNIGVIHDCFLVHPNYGDEIRDHYKEGYIEIMKSKPLEKFSKELDPEGKIEVPCIGTLDLEEVRDSEYIIS